MFPHMQLTTVVLYLVLIVGCSLHVEDAHCDPNSKDELCESASKPIDDDAVASKPIDDDVVASKLIDDDVVATKPIDDDVKPPENELRIMVLGKANSGKVETGNIIVGRTGLFGKSKRNSSVLHDADRFGKQLNVVVTPDFFDTEVDEDKSIAEVAQIMWFTSPGPHALLLCLKVGDPFTDDHIKPFSEYTDGILEDYVIIIFSHADKVEKKHISIEEYLENIEDEYYKSQAYKFLSRFGNRYMTIDTTLSKGPAANEQVQKLIQIIERMMHENSRNYYTDHIYKELEGQLQVNIKRDKATIEVLIDELEKRITKENDEETLDALEELKETFVEKIDGLRKKNLKEKEKYIV